MKKQNRHLKLMLSIGGWTYSPSFHPVVVNPVMRETFVKSSIALLENYGLDGLDVDYEYPSNDAQARGYVDLLRELRQGLDQHAHHRGTNYTYPLTVSLLDDHVSVWEANTISMPDRGTLRTLQL